MLDCRLADRSDSSDGGVLVTKKPRRSGAKSRRSSAVIKPDVSIGRALLLFGDANGHERKEHRSDPQHAQDQVHVEPLKRNRLSDGGCRTGEAETTRRRPLGN